MKIRLHGEPRVIMDNPGSRFRYFAWPSAARLQNGDIAVTASGFRLRHICPFGKACIMFSRDGGETYTPPAPVIDTVLDDRDTGVTAFGESGVIVTSFNNAVAFQEMCLERGWSQSATKELDAAYLALITPEEEAAALGATYRISRDGGRTWGQLRHSPVTSPHGPAAMPDGSLLWVGRTFAPMNAQRPGEDRVRAYHMQPDGTMEYRGEIAPIVRGGRELLSCEPHAVCLPDGRVYACIRVQGEGVFTVYGSSSADGGRTWSAPRQILSDRGGAPPHLLLHSSGVLILSYGYREEPCGIRVRFSRDGGGSWSGEHVLYETDAGADLGYPATVEGADGGLLTVFYARPAAGEPAVIWQRKWSFFDDEI